MGFFSDMNMEQETDREQAIDCQAKAISANDKQVETVPLSETAAVVQAAPSASAESKPEPEKVEPTQEEKRKVHEEAEAKRKAEWEEKQRQRKEKERIAWEKAIAMDNDALVTTSVKRLGNATERLTRRNMKLCVTEYVQTLCYEDIDFARLVMHPRKSMINCFHYINRKAREYLEKEMKDNDEKPEANGFGGDVPDDICYQWAEAYFRDMDTKEDQTDEDEKFVPKPYPGSSPAPKKKAEKKKPKPAKKEEPKKPEQMQITLESFMPPVQKAG